MSGGKTTQTSSNKIDPAQLALFNQNYAKANAVADRPFQPYTGEMTAPANPMLNQSFGMFGDIANNNIGASTLNSAMDATKGVAGYQPFNVNVPNVSGGDLLSGIAKYQNPYTSGVIDTTMRDLERQRQMQRVNDSQAGTAAGAFGGSRSGVADALTNEAFQRTGASTFANLRQRGFDTASGLAQSDAARALTAAQSNQNAALSAGQSNQSAGLAGAGLRLNAGAQLGAMSDQELRQALSRAGAVGAVGDQQRTIQQQLDDAAYQEFLRQWMYPEEQQQQRNAALGMINPFIQQTTTGTQKTQKNAFSSFLDALTAVGSFIKR